MRPFRKPRPLASIPPPSLILGLIPGRTLVVVINRVALLVGVPLHLAALRVSAAPVCEITVTVEAASSSPGGEHKFKVGGLMASWSGAGAPAYELNDGAWGMAGHHGQWPVRPGDNDDPERGKAPA